MRLTYSGREIRNLGDTVIYRKPVQTRESYAVEKGVVIKDGHGRLRFKFTSITACSRNDFNTLKISLAYNPGIREEKLLEIVSSEETISQY